MERIEQRFIGQRSWVVWEAKHTVFCVNICALRKSNKRQLKDKSKLNHTDENFSRESQRNQTKECVLHKSKRDLFIPKINFTRCVYRKQFPRIISYSFVTIFGSNQQIWIVSLPILFWIRVTRMLNSDFEAFSVEGKEKWKKKS